jgi:hypothetical protein
MVLEGFEETLNVETHAYFNHAFDGGPTGVEYLAPDLMPFISATHKWSPEVGSTGFSNLLPATAINETQIAALKKYGASFKDAQGNTMPLRFDTLIVKLGSDREREAMKLFGNYGGQYSPTAIGSVNIYQGSDMKMISTPYISDAMEKAYFFVDSRFLGEGRRGNPLMLRFLKRPGMIDGLLIDKDNNDYIYNFGGHRKTGIRNIPFARCGSVGA